MDHKKPAKDDMHYLVQPRGSGTGWVFRMVTPPSLIGTPNPWDGKPFGREIKRGLGTRHLPEARKRRDIALGDIRRLESPYATVDDYSLESALEWRETLAEERAAAPNAKEFTPSEGALVDRLDAAERRGGSSKQIRSFARVASGAGLPITKAATDYKADRKPGNPYGYKPLAETTRLNFDTAVKHLRTFLSDDNRLACLEDVTPELAHRFRDTFLPSIKTGRGTGTMSAKTVAKNVTLLKALWSWAIERRVIGRKHRKNPWQFDGSIPRSKKPITEIRQDFQPDEAVKLLKATKRGTREGDLVRLAFATGCRADELASLPAANVRPDGSGFHIGEGKTANAVRFVPVVGAAKTLLEARYKEHGGSGRLFPDWPLRPKTGKCYAVSQWFTRFRRDVLGKETDGRLSLHSTRHTWRTVARRARVAEADINQLGGWDGVRSSNSVYDHGLLEEQLTEAQQRIWDELMRSGYVNGF